MKKSKKSISNRLKKLRMLILSLIFLLISIIPIFSYSSISFERTYGDTLSDVGYSVQQTLDGGYIITGCIDCRRQPMPIGIYLVKTDSFGDTIWTKTFGRFTDSEYRGCSIQQTFPDGGYIIAGCTEFATSGIEDEVYLIRTDSIGDTLWTRKYGGSDYDNGISVQQTSDGGFVVVGWTQSFGAGSRDVYLIKTNSIGDTLWTRTYGGTGDDRGYSVKETQDGGYIIGGFTKSYGAGLADIYVIKTNSLGFPTGARTFGNADEDRGYSIQETSDGGYIITGYIGSFGSVERDIYIIKTDAVLDTVWTLKRDILGYDEGYSIQETSNGGYIITGCTNCNSLSNSIVFLMKIDTLGNPLWIRPFTGTSGSWGYSGQQTTDGGYVITGYTNYGVNGWLTDVYLIKTDGDGLVGVEEESNKYRTPDIEFRLFQNFLNPFHRTTLIRYQIASSNHVTLTVYDITGRMMETLVNEKKDPGVYQLEWDGKDQSSGIYFYRLHCNDFITTKKMILLR